MAKKITIEHYTAEGFISEIAEDFGLSLEKEEREFCVSLASTFGRGYIKGYDFDHGLSVFEFDCSLEENLKISFKKNSVQPLILLFNREEPLILYKNKDAIEVRYLECIMSCNGLHEESTIELISNQSACFLALIIDRKSFEEKITDFVSSMDDKLESIFRDVNGVNPFFGKWHYSLDIAKFMEEFTSCEHTDFMKHIYLEGKSYEILTHFFMQFLDDLSNPSNRTILRQRTVEKIEEASTIIENELEALGSILSIAKKVGLNQNTLQEGFKKLYKKSVNQYIKDKRLDKAKDLMENTDLNITEITYKLGINSRSYFSKLFKERYGMAPKEYILIHRKGPNSRLTG